MARGQADALFPMIDAVLAEARVAWRDVDMVATIAGPGSFTGVRVGVGAARGLALGLGRPAIGVDGYDAVAAAAWGDGARCDRFAACFGRGSTLTWRRYALADGVEALDAAPRSGDADGLTRDGVALAAGPGAGDGAAPVVEPSSSALIGALAKLALESWAATAAAGEPSDAPRPIYARPPDAAPSAPAVARLSGDAADGPNQR